MHRHQLALLPVEGSFAVCRLTPTAPVPSWAQHGPLVSITRTAEELSLVCPDTLVPDGTTAERGWRCLRVAGSMAFTTVGVLASLVAPLAEASVGVFALSTFDTDYLLVKETDYDKAVGVLRLAGHVLP